jgi:hypothetical protein
MIAAVRLGRTCPWNVILLFCISVLPLSECPAEAQPRQLLKLGGVPTYIHGANLAWLDGACDHDIGINPRHPNWGCAYNSKHVAAYFSDMKEMNLNVVRVWLFENLEGLTFDDDGEVKGLHPTFVRNLDDMVSTAESVKIRLYLCLSGGIVSPCQGLGVKNFLTDESALEAYLDNAVRPLTERYRGNDWIFAFDIMNEPEQDVNRSEDKRSAHGVSWEIMRKFIRKNAEAIHQADPSRLVSCSSGDGCWTHLAAGRYLNLGLDFYDHHCYSATGELPPVSTLNLDRPVILGEYGHRPDRVDPDYQNKVAKAFLENAVKRGYAGTLIWNYDWPKSPKPFPHQLHEGGGSNKWRPVCYTLKNFDWRAVRHAARASESSEHSSRPAHSGTIFDGTRLENWGSCDERAVHEVVQISRAGGFLTFTQDAAIYAKLSSSPQNVTVTASFRCPQGKWASLFLREDRCVRLGAGASGTLIATKASSFKGLGRQRTWNEAHDGRTFRNVGPVASAERPFGTWNEVRAICSGSRWTVWINGVQVNQADDGTTDACLLTIHALPGFEIRDVRLTLLSRSDRSASTSAEARLDGVGFRTWNDNTGQYSLEARLAGRSGSRIKLEMLGGKVIWVELSRLCDGDRNYVRDQLYSGASR